MFDEEEGALLLARVEQIERFLEQKHEDFEKIVARTYHWQHGHSFATQAEAEQIARENNAYEARRKKAEFAKAEKRRK